MAEGTPSPTARFGGGGAVLAGMPVGAVDGGGTTPCRVMFFASGSMLFMWAWSNEGAGRLQLSLQLCNSTFTHLSIQHSYFHSTLP